MALIECPDCGREVSDSAAACIGCGRPMQPVTIERTSKRYKAGMLFGLAFAFIGFLSANVLGGEAAIILMATGGLCFLVSLIAGWWNNG